jgi:acyl-CoA oxidase
MSDFSDKLQPLQPSGTEILSHERASSDIDIDQLANHLLHRNDFLDRQRRILAELERHTVFSKKNQLDLARPDRYHLGLARAKTLRRLSLKHGWDLEDYRIAEYLVDEMSPYHVGIAILSKSYTDIKIQAAS